ncbi:hypothetical protein NQZ68_023001 [Dissostichus eleginoides]|nr:hypothetical protein NQZ68_023001 [Dissostichus eleginoides]
MGELRTTSTGLRLDLNNFDSAEAERSRYVLTSPRSLESCTRLGVKPVELLIKSLNELVADKHHVPYEAMRVVHESYEKERMKRLQMCREERERIIRAAAGDRWPGSDKVPGPEVVPDSKLKDHSRDIDTMRCILYADLCVKGKSASRSSYREPDRSTVCSVSLGDLRYTPATEMKLERLTRDINKEMCVTLSEKDRKIAALMLVKHQEEQACLKICQREEQERQEARRQQEAQRAEAEKQRRKKLRRSMQRWHDDLEGRMRLRERKEKEKAVQLELEVVLHEDRWRRQKEEVEGHHREKIEAAHREAEGRKHYQEKLLREREEVEKRERERERHVAEEKKQRARRSKVSQEREERRRLQEGNRRELLRHILLKQKTEQQGVEEVEQMRSTFEMKMRLSCEKHAQAVDARVREVQERAAREELQIQRAQLRAKLQSYQELTHKQILVQLSQRRSERAGLHAEAQQRSRAEEAQQHNQHRQTSHLRLRERRQRDEEEERKVTESCIFMKDVRRERLRRQREQIQEEAHRLARASFHMRERVRQHTHSRTFDQMAREAQLTASMSCMKI